MDEAANDLSAVPVWARPTAFPEAPAGWGWVDPKGVRHNCTSAEALSEVVASDDTGIVDLVWTPDNDRMLLPGEVPALHQAILTSRTKWVRSDLEEFSTRLWRGLAIFGAIFAWVFYGRYSLYSRIGDLDFTQQILLSIKQTLNNNTIEIGFLLLVMFVIIPWYQAKKRFSELGKLSTPEGHAETLPAMRFETWLSLQNAPFTKIFLGLIAIVGVVQFLPGSGIDAAGLLKDNFKKGETWRLFTAPFLHGNPIHFAMNAAALLYLGKRLEVFARWPHLAMVFLFSALIGGQASVIFLPETPSVGASGGLMGWLGFLLAFETLHSKLVPRSSRRRLAAAVFLTALIGLLGHRFIDNAAHAGGLLAGILYAVIVFPKSDSAYRPTSTTTDRIIGMIALAGCAASALFAVWKIIAA